MAFAQYVGVSAFRGSRVHCIFFFNSSTVQSNVWDIDNPERITLPCANPNERHDIKCIAAVEGRIWVGAGPSIFFLNAEMPSIREVGGRERREGSI